MMEEKKKTTLGADGEIFQHDDRNKNPGNGHHKHLQNSFEGIITILSLFDMYAKENVIK